jgi:hypothetical protein
MIEDKPVPALYPQSPIPGREPVPERMMLFGVGGVGKSSSVLQIARRLSGDRCMYVIDTDYSAAYDRLLATEFQSVQDRVSTLVVGPDDFKGVMEAIVATKKLLKPHDWLVLDSITPTWAAVQSWFVEQVHGQNIEDYFLEVRKVKAEAKGNKKALGALDGWMDWPVINKVYFRLYAELLGTPANVIVTAEQGAISDDDDKEVKGAFGTYGVKPVGQKKLGFIMHTNLWLTKSRVGEYRMTTIKDRGRPEQESATVGDFGMDYLFRVAGWRPQPQQVAA